MCMGVELYTVPWAIYWWFHPRREMTCAPGNDFCTSSDQFAYWDRKSHHSEHGAVPWLVTTVDLILG